MYSNKEIKLSLRKYIASTGNTDIDEKSVINLLDDDFSGKYEDVVETIKKIRLLFGVKRQIPDWLKMLTFRFVYHYLCDDTVNKSQEELLKDIGFNKKVFDGTSWQMYSPDMKLRQSRFNPVDFPFSYAEVESNPIYVAMLHHLISEARVHTNTFIDVFGKMGYVPAFCAEGYAHKILYSAIPDGDYDADVFYKYYHGITDRPTKTYKVLQRYMAQIQSVLDEKYDEDERDLRIRKIVSDKVLFIAMGSSDLCEYSAIKFCDMCFRKPYWEERNVENHIVEKKKERKLHGKVYQTTEKIVEKDKDRIIIHDYSSIPKAEDYLKITKEMFVAYAAALKNVKFMGDTTSLIDGVYENMDAASIYEELDLAKELREYFKEIVHDKTPLLYVDVPKYGEYIRFNFSDEEYMKLLEFLLIYKGDWILSFKRYNQARGDYVSEKYNIKDFLERMKASERPLFEYKYSTKDRNVRNSISFITTIDFDELTVQEFKDKYNLESAKINSFQKIQVNI